MHDLRILIIGAPPGFVDRIKLHFPSTKSLDNVNEEFFVWVNNTPFQRDLLRSLPLFRTNTIRVPVEPERSSVIIFYEDFLRTGTSPNPASIKHFKAVAGTKEPPTYLVVVAASYETKECREFLIENKCDFDGVFKQTIDASILNDSLFDLANSRYRWVINLVQGSHSGMWRFLAWKYILPAIFLAIATLCIKAYFEEIAKSAGGATYKYLTEKPVDGSKPQSKTNTNVEIRDKSVTPSTTTKP